MKLNDKIYIAGHGGMVCSAIYRLLKNKGFNNFIFQSHKELDLLNEAAVKSFFTKERPDFVILAAARVGGIQANIDHPAEFLYENICIQNNIIHQSYLHKIKSELEKMLIRETRLELFKSCMSFLDTRIELDQSGFKFDIFDH